MVKQPAMEPSEFTMSHEDFPALPGVPASSAAAGLNSTAGSGQATNTIGDAVSLTYLLVSLMFGLIIQIALKSATLMLSE